MNIWKRAAFDPYNPFRSLADAVQTYGLRMDSKDLKNPDLESYMLDSVVYEK